MIRVPYKGRPAPEIIWSVDGEVIETSRRKVEIKTHPHHSTLVIHDAEKKDSGVYKFLVENSVGYDMVNIPVHVIGKQFQIHHKKKHSAFKHYLKQPKIGFCKLIHSHHQIVQDLPRVNQLLRASLNSLSNCHGCPQQTMVVQKSLVTSLRSLTHRQECGDGL